MHHLPNIHPGEVLQEEFLTEFNLTAYRLAQAIGIPQTRLSEIVKRKRRITADPALRLGRYFGHSPRCGLERPARRASRYSGPRWRLKRGLGSSKK